MPGQASMYQRPQETPTMGQMQPVGDGNQDFRAAKRLKPTTKTLPKFDFHVESSERLEQSVETLNKLSESYAKLQQLEKKMDWTISKAQVEASEKSQAVGARRKLRFHVHAKAIDQPWQVQGETQPDFDKGTNIPRVQIQLTAELLPRTKDGQLTDEEKALRFADLVKQVTVEAIDSLERPGPVEWRKTSTNKDIGGLTLSVPSTGVVTFRLAVYPNHDPDLFAVPGDLASLIEMSTGERSEIMRALWTYARKNDLVEPQGLRTHGDKMKKLFHNQSIVAFHHLPEYLNRYLAPPGAMLLEVKANANSQAEEHAAWDMIINTKDTARKTLETLYPNLSIPVAEINTLDNDIASACTRVQPLSTNIKLLSEMTAHPVEFLERYTASQSVDLGKALGDHELGFKEGGWQPTDWIDVIKQARI